MNKGSRNGTKLMGIKKGINIETEVWNNRSNNSNNSNNNSNKLF